MKLMIVDDNPGTRELIRKMIGLPDVNVRECASGDEAVQCARDFRPDWVTMDVHMPGLNGFQSAAAVHAEHPPARIIIVTNDSEPCFRQLAHSAGAVGLVLKENLMALPIILSKESGGANPPALTAKI